jgi:hypothetical protein
VRVLPLFKGTLRAVPDTTSGSSRVQIQKDPSGPDDGGSGINVLYASTLDDMGIPRSQLLPSTTPFHGVVPRMEALPNR